MGQRIYPNRRHILQAPDDLAPAHFRTHLSADINDTGTACHNKTRINVFFCLLINITHGSYTGLAQIIPARPHEIACHGWQFLYQLPVFIQRLWQGLGSGRCLVWTISSIFFIAAGRIIISRNIKDLTHLDSHGICLFGRRSLSHQFSHLIHEQIKEIRGWHSIHATSSTVLDLSLVIRSVNALFAASHHSKHQVDTCGHRTRLIFFMAKIYHDFRLLLSIFHTEFCDLISDRIHDNGWMVVVFGDHSLRIRFPPFLELITCIVIWIFVDQPHIKSLIHHIHTHNIAGI